uniref:Uncharacterized protein n=1 Tax=Tanacetum cinerariifolium TaxID=118510 RepID=A0A6L2LIV5_TANCI|nr:hypothetical protein [Tanacetum cinerariifolium]
MYYQKNVDYVALLWEDFLYQADNIEISSTRKEHMPYPRFTKVIINHFISKDNIISMRNRINLHIVCDDTLLVPPKKVRKFKKPASPKLKTVPASLKEPTQKDGFDDDENPSFILKDYEEKVQEEEYMDTPMKEKYDDEENMVSTLETKVSEFNQTSQFAEAVSLILGIIDNYLASKLKEEVNVMVRLQSKKLKEDTEAKNQEFINQVDLIKKKIIKEQVKAQVSKIMPRIEKYITEYLGAEIIQSTSYILHKGTKRRKSSKDAKPTKCSKSKESNSSSSSKGIQSQHKSSGKSTQAEKPEFKAADTKMHQDQGNEYGNIDDQPDNKAASKHDWFQKPEKPLTPNRASNKSKSVDFRPPPKWINTIAKECYKERQPPRMFVELMSTPINFSTYVMNPLKIDNLTQEIVVGPIFILLKGTSKSFTKLEYHFEECYKAVNDPLDWHNAEGCEYPFNLSNPLPMIKDQRRQVVPADYFIKNDLNVKAMRWYDYGYLIEIVVQRDDNVLYKFIEDDRYDLGVALRRLPDVSSFFIMSKTYSWELKAIRRSSTSLEQRQPDLKSPN